ncbi:MAG: aldo/keto reductase [Lachnospiraceae bacterium]|nr:aldo/keto reductase [Lachnospiraceae bacterium]
MRHINFGNDDDQVSEVILGTMNLGQLSEQEAQTLLESALEDGINFIDTADCYGAGASEEMIGKVFQKNPGLRKKFFLQSKCGIRVDDDFTWFDFSAEHILEAVDASLKRLQTESLDCLLLHRPDALMEPDEIADAFRILHKTGKVRSFGVSNMNPMMIGELQKATKYKLATNQVQLSCAFTPMIDAGFQVNMQTDGGVMRDGGILGYCRQQEMTIQAWSPLRYGYFEGIFIGDEKYAKLNAVLDRIAQEQGVSSSAIALAWILRYPARMQVVAGTTKPERLSQLAKAGEIELTRKQWYEIYLAAGNQLP